MGPPAMPDLDSQPTADQPPARHDAGPGSSQTTHPDQPTTDPAVPPGPSSGGPLPQVPGYVVENEVARGGMGVVYRAWHVRLNRPAAIKMILAGPYQNLTTRLRFLIEAEAVARVQHPHVVPVYEFGQVDGQPFLAMEFVGGGTLAARLAEAGRPTPRVAAETVAKLADAVAAAHALGVVHRDLKPANVLLTDAGEPKITDFGLARMGDSGVTVTGAVLGTPSYMSPEQAAGRTREVGTAADIYGLGAILYELLAGRPPFVADTPLATLRQVIDLEPERPRRVDGRVPRDLETVCLKCLEKDPRKRYTTADALRNDLRAVLDGRPIRARRVGGLERAVKWARRRPVIAGLVALVMAVGVAGFLAALGQYREAQVARREAADRADRESRAKDDARRALGEAESNLYQASLTLAEREWATGNLDGYRQCLEQCPPARRRWEWHYLDRRGRELLDLPDRPAVGGAAFSPDGSRLATAGNGGTARVWDALTGRLLFTLPGLGGPVGGLTWTPDGTGLLVAEGRTVRVWDITDPAAPRGAQLGQHAATTRAVAHHPTKPWVAVAVGDIDHPDIPSEVVVWDRTTGQRVRTLTGHTGAVYTVVFSPDGSRLASGGDDMTAIVWNPDTGERVRTLDGHKSAVPVTGGRVLRMRDAGGRKAAITLQNAAVFGVAFAPDGKLLATASGDGTIKVWDVAGGQEKWTLTGHDGPVLGVAFSPSGQLLASVGMDRTVRLWSVAGGREVRRYLGHADEISGVVFRPRRPDGLARLVTCAVDGTAKVWDPDQPQEGRIKRNLPASVFGLAISPDGREVAAGCGDLFNPFRSGPIRVFDPADNRDLYTLPGHRSGVTSLAYSPDGTRLASGAADGTVKLWDVAGRREVWEARLKGQVSGMAVAPDGKSVAACSVNMLAPTDPGDVKVLDAATGAVRYALPHPSGVGGLAYSPDGRLLATGSADHLVRLFDTTTAVVVQTLPAHPNPILGLCWSPDGTAVAAAGGDPLKAAEPGEVRVWDVRTGAERLALRGHAQFVTSVLFTPDGERLVSGSRDGTVRVWDAATGRQVLVLRGASYVLRVAVSRDGRWLAGGNWGGTVNLWEGQPTAAMTGP